MTYLLPPRPGDRYRNIRTGSEYIVSSPEGALINLASGTRYACNRRDPFDGDRGEFVHIQPPEDAPAPIKLVEGHRYALDNGEVIGPLAYRPTGPADRWPWLNLTQTGYGAPFFTSAGENMNGPRIVKDLGPVEPTKPPRHEPKLGDVYRHRSRGSLYVVMYSTRWSSARLELRCVGGGDKPGCWWCKDSKDLFDGDEDDFEYIGNGVLKV